MTNPTSPASEATQDGGEDTDEITAIGEDNIHERLVLLETKLAYQEKFIDELSGVIHTQQQAITRLEGTVTNLVEQVRGGGQVIGPNEPPPHY
ncbi:MAG: SlyX family protein [Polyangiaceae bacterium]|nr:SlyX family protein [Polyangiaceae bacterium]